MGAIVASSSCAYAVFSRKRCRPVRQSGSVVIELLMVITIISILAAIPLPAFARTTQSAPQFTCIAGLSPESAVTAACRLGHRADLPTMPAPSPEDVSASTNNDQVFECPNNDVTKAPNNPSRPDCNRPMLETLVFGAVGFAACGAIRYDFAGEGAAPVGPTVSSWAGPHSTSSAQSGRVLERLVRYNDGVNVAYFDGHVNLNRAASPTCFTPVLE